MIVIGNGISRKKIDFDKIDEVKVGCNAIFRDYFVEYLVCCDKRIVKQALEYHNNIYTRSRWNRDFGVNALPSLPYKGDDRKDDPFHWGTGPYAILLACSLSKNIKIVGFDLYGVEGKVNNIYSGTEGYSDPGSSQVDHSYWIYQIEKIFQYFPEHQFIIYQTSDWKCPNQWNYPNVSLDTLDNL